MNKTGIEYLTHTWNPIAMRCSEVSTGCLNCWHLRTANRHAANKTIRPAIREARAGGKFALLEDELAAPARARKPARIGVQFMGDLFHESVPGTWLQEVFAAMMLAPQHTYLLLTKRPQNARRWLDAMTSGEIAARAAWARMSCGTPLAGRQSEMPWPLPNIWLGVSVEDQERAHERIPELLKTPAEVRFVSYEPAVGPVDSQHWPGPRCCASYCLTPQGLDAHPEDGHRGIDWVIAGAETGAARRHADPDWFRLARDRCAAERIPFFFKRQTDGRRELDGVLHEAMP